MLNTRSVPVDTKHLLLSDAFIVGYYNYIEGVAFETFGDHKFKLNPHLRAKNISGQAVYEQGRRFGVLSQLIGVERINWIYQKREVHPDVTAVWVELNRLRLLDELFVRKARSK